MAIPLDTATGNGDSGGPFICPDKQGKPTICGIASFGTCEGMKICKRPSYFLRTDKFVGWIKNKTNNAEQEKEYLVNEPMVPESIKDKNVPGYVVRISGPKQTCTGTLVSPNQLVTSSNCINKNMGMWENERKHFYNVYHFRSERGYDIDGHIDFAKPEDLDISINITKHLGRPLGREDYFWLQLKNNVDDYQPLELPPTDYQITGIAEEYSMNEKAGAIQRRRYTPLEKNTCIERLNKIDTNLTLGDTEFCMRRAYSAEADCKSRDLGGPLVCDGKYFCGIKNFQACGTLLSSLPEIYNDNRVIRFQDRIKKLLAMYGS